MNPEETPESTPPMERKVPRPKRPLGVYVISFVVGLQALALAAAGIWFTVGSFLLTPHSVASTVFMIVLLFAFAAGLAAVSVNAFKGLRWTRSAAFVWQLLMVAVAVPALLGGPVPLGLALVIPAVATIFFLFTPKVVEFSLLSNEDQSVL